MSAGFTVGIVVGLCGVGGGALMTPFLIQYGINPAVAVGTDLAHAVPLLTVAALGHWQLGNVDFQLFDSLLPGVIPGVYIGTRLGVRLPEVCLRRGLAVALLLLGGTMVMM